MRQRWRLGVAVACGVALGLSAGSLRSQDRGAVVPGENLGDAAIHNLIVELKVGAAKE